MTCVFCEIVHDRAPSRTLGEWVDGRVIVPLNPVTPGHVLVLPTRHVEDWADPRDDAEALVAATRIAHEWARDVELGDANLITSRGPAATQTIGHLHLHVVPRREGDGLALPWTGQRPA